MINKYNTKKYSRVWINPTFHLKAKKKKYFFSALYIKINRRNYFVVVKKYIDLKCSSFLFAVMCVLYSIVISKFTLTK